MTTRRDLLKSLLAAGALAGFGREAFAVQPVRRPKPGDRLVALGLLLDPDTDAGRGARLGLEEAQRAGQLLHVDISAAPTSEYALIGLAAPKEEPKALFLAVAFAAQGAEMIRPHVYWVAASPAFRRQALDR
ncbi:MAG TPA: twin-arginine translocation signal domain-containing protein, partial [Thermoanaerobaculia bacterium]